MTGKKNPDKTSRDNGDIINLLESIVKKQKEQDERLEEMEDHKGGKDAQLRLVNLCFDPSDQQLPGLTRLPLRATMPFALGMMMDKLTSKEVLSGEVSLQQIFYRNYFQLMRSVGAEAFNKAVDLAGEQAAAETERGTGLDLGNE